MRAWLRIFNTWMPDFLIDNHVTDGSDMQYDVTWDMARNQDIAEPAGAWVREKFVPELDKRMAADGHMVAPYGALRNVGGKREFFMEVFSPRYSHLYAAVQNRPSLLVETHSLKTAKTRAWAHYDIMRHTIDTILLRPRRRCASAVREADRRWPRAPETARRRRCIWRARCSDKSRPLVYHALKNGPFKSEVTGAMVTRYTGELDDIQTVIHDQIDTTVEAQMPLGLPDSRRVADPWRICWRCTAWRWSAPRSRIEQEFETYRFTSTKFAAASIEGHVML